MVEYFLGASPGNLLLVAIFFLACSLFGITVGAYPFTRRDIKQKIIVRFTEKTLESIFSLGLGSTALPFLILALAVVTNKTYIERVIQNRKAEAGEIEKLKLGILSREDTIRQLTSRDERTASEITKLMREKNALFDRLNELERGLTVQDRSPKLFRRDEYPSCSIAGQNWQAIDSIAFGRLIVDCSEGRFLAFRCVQGEIYMLTDGFHKFTSVVYYYRKQALGELSQQLIARRSGPVFVYYVNEVAYKYFLEAQQARLIGSPNEPVDLTGLKKIVNTYFDQCPP